MQPFSIGDRVEYRDPESPRDPLTGEVVDVTEHAISVRYDAHPHAPGLLGLEAARTALRHEQDVPR